MKYSIQIGEELYELSHPNIDRSINVDDLTTIDTSNLFGEHTTISAATNRIGLLRSEVQAIADKAKMSKEIYEAEFIERKRLEAKNNSGKFFIRVDNQDVDVKLTETALKSSFLTDSGWKERSSEYIKALSNYNKLDVLYWAMQDKSKKLNGLIEGTTPAEFVKGLVEGKVNGILVKKLTK